MSALISLTRSESVGELPRSNSFLYDGGNPHGGANTSPTPILLQETPSDHARRDMEARGIMSGLRKNAHGAQSILGQLRPRTDHMPTTMSCRVRSEEEWDEEEEEEDGEDGSSEYMSEDGGHCVELDPPCIGQQSSNFAGNYSGVRKFSQDEQDSESDQLSATQEGKHTKRPGKKIPLQYDNWPSEVVNLPCKQFHAFIKERKLTPEQVKDLKRVRRREQGKRAARNSRRRQAELRLLNANQLTKPMLQAKPKNAMESLLEQNRELEMRVAQLTKVIERYCPALLNGNTQQAQ